MKSPSLQDGPDGNRCESLYASGPSSKTNPTIEPISSVCRVSVALSMPPAVFSSGSGKAISFVYVTDDTNPSHSIQGYTITYGLGDVR